MKRVILLLLILVSILYSQTIREMRFENVKLETVLKAISEASGMNIIFDPEIFQDLEKLVSVAIYKPMPVGEAMNIILKTHGLVAVPVDKRVYRITKAGEITFDITNYTDSQVNELINLLKARVSPSAEIVVDKALRKVFVRDELSKIEQLKKFQGDIEKASRRAELQEEYAVKVFYLKREVSYRDISKALEALNIKDIKITESPEFNALIISARKSDLDRIEKAIERYTRKVTMEAPILTKTLYIKHIPVDSFINLIKPMLSEVGEVYQLGTGEIAKGEQQAAGQTQQEAGQTQQGAGQTQQGAGQTQQGVTGSGYKDAIIIRDYADVVYKIIEKYKDLISEVPIQIRIEARVVQIRSSATRELGINWQTVFSNVQVLQNLQVDISPTFSPPGTLITFIYQRGILNTLNLRLSALERIRQAKVLSKPTVLTLNGETATIESITEVPIIQTNVVPGGTASISVQYIQVPISLRVKPLLLPEGNIILEITINKAEIVSSEQITLGGATNVIPTIVRQSAGTKLVVGNGDVVVLGGVVEAKDIKNESGVPGLIKIPLIRWLFMQQKIEKEDTELLIFIQPTVITQ